METELTIGRLASSDQPKINKFLTEIFHVEQQIPVSYIPLQTTSSLWWGLINTYGDILGTVASWKEEQEWHWGRFAVHPHLRGRGYGTKLASRSLKETFVAGASRIIIDARSTTVKLILSMGGSITGHSSFFFNSSITPMVLEKELFICK